MPETWYVQPNDEIGGWCVMTTDDPPSAGEGRMVATFTAEADARRIVDLHNAESGGPAAADLDAILRALTPADEIVRCRIATALIRFGVENEGDDLFEWHPCTDNPNCLAAQNPAAPCACSGRPYLSDAAWASIRETLAGRLLPEGGETIVETEVVWLKDGRERDTATYENLTDEYWAGELAAAMKYGVDLGPRRRREVRQWPDGSTLVGPWVAVDQEATDAAD